MDDSETVEQATGRLNAAIDAIEAGLASLADDAERGDQAQAEFAKLSEDHGRLSAEVDVERVRAERLKSANEDVSERLGSVIESIRSALGAA